VRVRGTRGTVAAKDSVDIRSEIVRLSATLDVFARVSHGSVSLDSLTEFLLTSVVSRACAPVKPLDTKKPPGVPGASSCADLERDFYGYGLTTRTRDIDYDCLARNT
jgi:hypothetical protein